MFVVYIHAQTSDDSASEDSRTVGRSAASGICCKFRYDKIWLFLNLQEPYCLQEMSLVVQVERDYEMNANTMRPHIVL